MNLKKLLFLKATSGGGGETETGYTHENVKKIRINGNEYAFGNASVANRKNYAVISQVPSGGGGVAVEMRRNVVIVNGTSSGVNDIFLNTELVDIPAGTYKAIVTPYMGQSAVVTGKNMYMDFWYDLASDYAVRATFSGVKDSKVETTVTFTSPVVKMRAIVGVRGVKYDDYRLCYELFPSDVSFTDIGSPVPPDGHLDYTFGTEQSFVDSRMHTSTIKK